MSTAEPVNDSARLATSFDPEERRRFFAELVRYECSRSYRPGWSWRAYLDRFGSSPLSEWERDLPATLIRPTTFAWIRARAAEFAKSREARAARGRKKKAQSPDMAKTFHELSHAEAVATLRAWDRAGASEADLVRLSDWNLRDVRRALGKCSDE
jgi:hypothetical protein